MSNSRQLINWVAASRRRLNRASVAIAPLPRKLRTKPRAGAAENKDYSAKTESFDPENLLTSRTFHCE